MKYYCKHCGLTSTSLPRLVSGSCSRSPSGRHERYYGVHYSARIGVYFFCEYCGKKSSKLNVLVKGECSKSPTKYHVAYEG
jgi:uncharacterized protein YuzB (UPF0349 family)